MAKPSISSIFEKRKRIRVLTILACLCLAFLSFQLITQNPRKTKAASGCVGNVCTIIEDGYFDIVGHFISSSGYTRFTAVSTSDVVINGAVTVQTSGQQYFKSLLIKNNAVLTHDALVPVTDFDISTSVLTLSGSTKKVDIVTTGNITLTAGGQINVDGKGFPGGFIRDDYGREDLPLDSHPDGYGPGHGHGGVFYQFAKAGGGGFAGVGGTTDPRFPGGAVSLSSLDYLNTPLQFGSGGGAAKSYRLNNFVYAITPGGAGGGVISLRANTLVIDGGRISSNGLNTQLVVNGSGGGVDRNAWGGAGSGGMILIGANNFNLPSDYSGISTVGTTATAGVSAAGLGKISADVFLPNSPQSYFQANGGDCENSEGSGGGGGLIVIKNISSTGVTIKKTLEPISRPYNAAPANPIFNPYALQIDDKILVRLTITNIVGAVTVIDDYLQTPGRSPKCNPFNSFDHIRGSYSHASINSGESVQFDQVTGDDAGTAELVYQCRVIK